MGEEQADGVWLAGGTAPITGARTRGARAARLGRSGAPIGLLGTAWAG